MSLDCPPDMYYFWKTWSHRLYEPQKSSNYSGRHAAAALGREEYATKKTPFRAEPFMINAIDEFLLIWRNKFRHKTSSGWPNLNYRYIRLNGAALQWRSVQQPRSSMSQDLSLPSLLLRCPPHQRFPLQRTPLWETRHSPLYTTQTNIRKITGFYSSIR